jgi:adenosine deaminase
MSEMRTNHLAPNQNREQVRRWARQLPKIDLHRHLEGSLRLSTLAEIAREHGLDLPAHDAESLRPYVQIIDDTPDFQRFMEKFSILRHFYTSCEAVQRVTREAIVDAAKDNIRYLELRFNPMALANVHQFPLHEVVKWVIAATEEAAETSGTRTCLILQIPRKESLAVAEEIVDLAIEYVGPVVRGIDLAGDEEHFPPDKFIEPFRRAREAGLTTTAHAGEAAGPESVRAAIECLNPLRIGHGIRAVESSEVVQMIYERDITLEVCPTSNIHTGAVRGFSQHPLIDLFNLRLHVTLNTDDPSVSDTTLSDEYVVAVTDLNLAPQLIYAMLRHSVDAAFIPAEERVWLRETIRNALGRWPGAVECFDAVNVQISL